MALTAPPRRVSLVVAVLALAACTGPTDAPAPTRAVGTPPATASASPACVPSADDLRLVGEPEVGETVLLRAAVERYEAGQLVESSATDEVSQPPAIVWSQDDPRLQVQDLEASEQARAVLERGGWSLTAPDTGSPRDAMSVDDPGSATFVFYSAARPLTAQVTVACGARTWTGVLHHWTGAVQGAVDCGHDPEELPDSARLALDRCPA
ncbi:hypothetical protein [Cellulomonas massiliensis]|uniref:hypothetical protein n=1 Tax=Cellulomonas massiliensis TaxID=1465811 RepID=UPI0002D7D5AA|nr:hypothetical protein [Cellulomonas massiliensis]